MLVTCHRRTSPSLVLWVLSYVTMSLLLLLCLSCLSPVSAITTATTTTSLRDKNQQALSQSTAVDVGSSTVLETETNQMAMKHVERKHGSNSLHRRIPHGHNTHRQLKKKLLVESTHALTHSLVADDAAKGATNTGDAAKSTNPTSSPPSPPSSSASNNPNTNIPAGSVKPQITQAAKPTKMEIKVLSLNVWENLKNCKTPNPAAAVAQIIRKLNVDVAGFQEIESDTVAAIAAALGGSYTSSSDPYLVTRFPIVKRYSWASAYTGSKARLGGVKLDVNGVFVKFVNGHALREPIAVDMVFNATNSQVEGVVNDLQKKNKDDFGGGMEYLVKADEPELPTVWIGDFNEPSILDLNENTVNNDAFISARHRGFNHAIKWPISTMMKDNQFTDVYRKVHPDVIKDPGFTYPHDASEHTLHDRIDFVYTRDGVNGGSNYHFVSMAADYFDQIPDSNDPWVSDHAGVVATIGIEKV